MGSLRDDALRYLNLGYVPLLVQLGSKAAQMPGWQTTFATAYTIEKQFNRPSNLGIRTGDIHSDGTCLVALDIDRDDGELVRCVQRAIEDLDRVPVKRGKKGCTFFFRLAEQVQTHKIHWYRDGKKSVGIDVLCKSAQTVIPPSVHQDTKLPYQWIAGPPLYDVPYEQLPVMSNSVLDEIKGFCAKVDDPIYALNDMQWCGVGGGGDTHEVCLAAVASMVVRSWPEEDIHARVNRAKREACEAAGMAFDWPRSLATIQGWIDSARAKFGAADKSKKVSHGALADAFAENASNHIRYDRDATAWYFFDGNRWRGRHDFRVMNAIELSLPIALRNSPTISGVEKSLRNRPALSIQQQDWDLTAIC